VTVRVGSCRIGGRVARTLAVARVEILHLIHDRTTISLILLVPAIQIVLFGYAVNLDPRHVPIAVAGDHGGRANQVSRVIGETGYFMIVADGLKLGAAERMVAQGKALGGIEVPPHEHSDRGAPLGEPKSSSTRPIWQPCVRLWQRLRTHIGGMPHSCMQLVRFLRCALNGYTTPTAEPRGLSFLDWRAWS
jgi:hypothetical protein